MAQWRLPLVGRSLLGSPSRKADSLIPQQVAPGLLSWASDIEPGTIEQAARLPFVPSHVALMADAHVGMGATVGSVLPKKDGASCVETYRS
ncbi:RtcB family protein [Streptosporangium sp. NPDC006013]|uniref:RtcB family protein n=1 Tax=Streptosporangium sp. NPDC006013 TaxID=3155596 RepID=UPI00339EC380